MAEPTESPTPEDQPRAGEGPPIYASKELLRAAHFDSTTRPVYPAGTTLTTADGREVTVEELGFKTHSKPDSSTLGTGQQGK
jgi:hypothetical protein